MQAHVSEAPQCSEHNSKEEGPLFWRRTSSESSLSAKSGESPEPSSSSSIVNAPCAQVFRRSLSKRYCGKSRSFSSLSECDSLTSVQDLIKTDHNKRARLEMEYDDSDEEMMNLEPLTKRLYLVQLQVNSAHSSYTSPLTSS
ncbi:hypothetical protein CYMTET_48202 [Cymbomonas tetramitiformis]|uniref:Uncharacterized protein n=1 Tax=Cymbomonas tetramitiformis TaxID=36881 RepID=A0AAE0BUH5_9CHLO|nr:hypothetical protein CYMTET_48202 [Cymbomonas tetramitiformis]